MAESFASNSSASTALARTRFRILGAISFSHFLNDMIPPEKQVVQCWYGILTLI